MNSEKPQLRVRIVRGGALYCLMTTVVLFVASYVQANLLFWIFGLMAGGLIVSFLLPWIMITKLSVVRRTPEHGVAGQMMTFEYDVSLNRRWLPAFGVVVHENWGEGTTGWQHAGPLAETPARLGGCPHGWATHVGPHQTVTATAPCWPLRRGMLRMEQVIISTSFPFGIFEWRMHFLQPDEVLIYPQMYRVNRRVIATLQDQDLRGNRQVDRAGGYEEFFGLREYHESDSIKLIHWRRSAHAGQMVSKEMTFPAPPRVMVMLDIADRTFDPPEGVTHEELIERAISLAASVISEAHHFGHRVGLSVKGAPCPPFDIDSTMGHRMKMLEALARMDVSNRLTDPTEPPEPPSIIVRNGQGDAAGGTMVTLSAVHMQRYVMGADPLTSPIVPERSGAS